MLKAGRCSWACVRPWGSVSRLGGRRCSWARVRPWGSISGQHKAKRYPLSPILKQQRLWACAGIIICSPGDSNPGPWARALLIELDLQCSRTLFLFEMVSCSPGWLPMYYIVEGGLELKFFSLTIAGGWASMYLLHVEVRGQLRRVQFSTSAFGLFVHNFHVIVHHCGKSGPELKAGTQRQELKNGAYCLAPHSFLSPS